MLPILSLERIDNIQKIVNNRERYELVKEVYGMLSKEVKARREIIRPLTALNDAELLEKSNQKYFEFSLQQSLLYGKQ